MPWAAVAGAVVGAVANADSSRRASNTQNDAARAAADANERMYQQNRADYAPWRAAGNFALSRMMGGMGGYNMGGQNLGQSYGTASRNPYAMLNTGPYQGPSNAYQQEQLIGQGYKVGDPRQPTPAQVGMYRGGGIPLSSLGAKEGGQAMNGFPPSSDPTMAPDYFTRSFGLADFQQDPGYQFRMNQGTEAIQNSAAARGGLFSGNTGRALAEYGQNFASNEYQNAYNRYNNDRSTNFNRFASLAGLGQTATRDVAQMGMNSAQNQANYGMQGANARAAGQMGQANAWVGGINGAANAYQQYNMMNQGGGWGGGYGGTNDRGGGSNYDWWLRNGSSGD